MFKTHSVFVIQGCMWALGELGVKQQPLGSCLRVVCRTKVPSASSWATIGQRVSYTVRGRAASSLVMGGLSPCLKENHPDVFPSVTLEVN